MSAVQLVRVDEVKLEILEAERSVLLAGLECHVAEVSNFAEGSQELRRPEGAEFEQLLADCRTREDNAGRTEPVRKPASNLPLHL